MCVFAISITGMILIFRGLRSRANSPPRWCRRGTLPESGRQKQRGHSGGHFCLRKNLRGKHVSKKKPSWVVTTSLVKQVASFPICHFMSFWPVPSLPDSQAPPFPADAEEADTMIVQIPDGAKAGDELTITTNQGQDCILSCCSSCCQQFFVALVFPSTI